MVSMTVYSLKQLYMYTLKAEKQKVDIKHKNVILCSRRGQLEVDEKERLLNEVMPRLRMWQKGVKDGSLCRNNDASLNTNYDTVFMKYDIQKAMALGGN